MQALVNKSRLMARPTPRHKPASIGQRPLRFFPARASSADVGGDASTAPSPVDPEGAHASLPAEAAPADAVPAEVDVEAVDTLGAAVGEAAPTPVSQPVVSSPMAQDIRAALLDSLYGTDRGLTARSEVRAEINELINQLETYSTSSDNVLESVAGSWRLLYSSSISTLALLATSRLPLLTVGDYVQTVDAAAMSVVDKVELSAANVAKTYLSSVATFTMASPKRMQLAFDKVIVHTPEPVPEAVDLPSSVTVMGQAIDVSPIRNLLAPIAEGMGATLSSAGDVLSQTPGLQLPASQFSTWLLNTYVDETLRIVRSDGGAVQVFVRQ